MALKLENLLEIDENYDLHDDIENLNHDLVLFLPQPGHSLNGNKNSEKVTKLQQNIVIGFGNIDKNVTRGPNTPMLVGLRHKIHFMS